MSREKEVNEKVAKILEGLEELIEVVGDDYNPRGSGCFRFDEDDLGDLGEVKGYRRIDVNVDNSGYWTVMEVAVLPKE